MKNKAKLKAGGKRRPHWIADMAGVAKDDPHFNMVLDEIRKHRKRIDRLAGRASK